MPTKPYYKALGHMSPHQQRMIIIDIIMIIITKLQLTFITKQNNFHSLTKDGVPDQIDLSLASSLLGPALYFTTTRASLVALCVPRKTLLQAAYFPSVLPALMTI